jgi:hypothetical protein
LGRLRLRRNEFEVSLGNLETPCLKKRKEEKKKGRKTGWVERRLKRVFLAFLGFELRASHKTSYPVF